MSDLAQQLRDLLQGASNAVAGNVTGPVDLISAGLRKVGLGNVIGPAPVGGSEWMAQKGLTRPTTDALASGAGETLGLLSPIAWAKAPQIANGLLTMAENAAKPSLLNPQLGAIVYHGSPHTFDKFDMSKIGTGEGAQAYGHGLYFADSPAVAQNYADKLSAVTVDGKTFSANDPGVARVMRLVARDPAGAKTFFDSSIAASKDAEQIAQWKAAFDLAEKSKLGLIKDSALYKVDLPDEHIAKMLDWDKPLSQQAPGVLDALTQAARQSGNPMLAAKARTWAEYPRHTTGEQAYKEFAADSATNAGAMPSWARTERAKPATSGALHEAGIPGIKYLDQGSRGAGEGTRNYVVFDDALPKILERNGLALK